MELDDLSLVVMGQEMDAMIGNLELAMNYDQTVAVSDEYVSTSDGRPTKLRRTFDRIAADQTIDVASDFESEVVDIPSESELEGRAVVFTWDEEAGEFAAAWDGDEEGDTALLEGLSEDMDLRALLPDGEVDEGDEWEIDGAALAGIAYPGGNLALLPEGADIDADMDEVMELFEELDIDFNEIYADLLTGDVKGTFKGTREVDGARVGVIEITADIESSNDFSQLILDVIEYIAEMEGASDVNIDVDLAELSLDYEGEGTLLWDLGEGRVHSFEMDGDVMLGFSFAMAGDIEGEQGDIEAELEFSGSLEASVETE